jgi:hypothetical protein
MDKEQARFILRSYRPDGADAGDPDFTEALRLAMEDRELGDWLANERAFDASFSQALLKLPLPDGLRQNILAGLAVQRGDFPQAETPGDALWIGALASIQPPPGLRENILAAMEKTAAASTIAPPIVAFRWKRLALPLAAAAGVVLAFVLTKPAPPAAVASNKPLPIQAVQAGFVSTYQSPLFSFDESQEDYRLLGKHLRGRKLPCPGQLPPGLRHVKSIGCRELVIDGRRGSLVCFDETENGVVHLVIFFKDDVYERLPTLDRAQFEQSGNWAVARWGDDEKAFMLIGHTKVDKLASLF